MNSHLVQYGIMGSIGQFQSVDRRLYARDMRVICRTGRGLELGTVITSHDQMNHDQVDGDLLRTVSPDDELILNRIERFRESAFRACNDLIRRHGFSTTLVDVEHLFDGQSVYFYFLGEVSPELDRLTSELGETYEAKVKFRQFSETLAKGCGPDCGTGVGCQSGGCEGCSVRAACSSNH